MKINTEVQYDVQLQRFAFNHMIINETCPRQTKKFQRQLHAYHTTTLFTLINQYEL